MIDLIFCIIGVLAWLIFAICVIRRAQSDEYTGDEFPAVIMVFGMRRVQKSTSFLKNVEPLMLGKLFDQD